MSKIRAGFNSEKDDNGQVKGSSEITLPHRNPYQTVGLRRPVSQLPEYIRKKKAG